MPTMYAPTGEAVLCDNDQVNAMLEAGFSHDAPAIEPAAEVETETGDDAKGKGKGK